MCFAHAGTGGHPGQCARVQRLQKREGCGPSTVETRGWVPSGWTTLLSGGNIDDGRTIKVNYGSLGITSTAIANRRRRCLRCDIGVWRRFRNRQPNATDITATVANDEDTGVGTVTINMGTAGPDSDRVFRHSERRQSGHIGPVCRRYGHSLHQFLLGPDRFRSHRSGQDRKRGRHGVHRQGRPDRETRRSQPALVQHRQHNRSRDQTGS